MKTLVNHYKKGGAWFCVAGSGGGSGATVTIVVVVVVVLGLDTSLDLRVSHAFISLFII